jgi:lipoprotein-anchoring transpeptidase ErfK/SrfK
LRYFSYLFALFSLTASLQAEGDQPAVPTTSDLHHEIIVSVKDQRLLLKTDGKPQAIYPVSTSRFGIGDRLGSYATPLGKFFVRMKIGMGQPLGAVFRSRRPTGEVLKPNAPGRDPIVTRILWLDGIEPANRNAFGRGIYIHGTPQESALGRPASYGCIRMRSKDVAVLCDRVGTGVTVRIINEHLPEWSGWGGFLNPNGLVAANARTPESSGEQEAE